MTSALALALHLLPCSPAAAQHAFQIGARYTDAGYAAAVDAAGNVYVTGLFDGRVDFDAGEGVQNLDGYNGDVFVASYDADGQYRYALSFGGSSGDYGRAIAVDGAGNVYVTGRFYGTVDFDPGAGVQNLTSAGGADVFVASYDASGAYRYAFRLGDTDFDEGMDIVVDAAGNLYLTGTFYGTADFDPGAGEQLRSSMNDPVYWGISSDAFLAAYDPDGHFVFAHMIGGVIGDTGYGVGLDAAGNVYVAGRVAGTVDFDPGAGTASLSSNASTYDAFLASYEPDGDYRYARMIGGSDLDEALGLAVDAAGQAYLTGTFLGTMDLDPGPGTQNATSAGGSDTFVAAYDTSGAYRYGFRFGGTSSDNGIGIAVDAVGNTYVTGFVIGTADFDPDAGSQNTRTSTGGRDAFVASYDATGAHRYAFLIGGTSDDYGRGIAVDAAESVRVTGSFTGTADFDPDAASYPLTSVAADNFGTSSVDAFVTRFAAGGALPVELASFMAAGDGAAVRLAWTTVSETNNAGFEVEHRPADQAAWRSHGFVAGAGTTREAQHYAFTVPGLAPGTHRFRLKQLDYDGTISFGPETEVILDVPRVLSLEQNYPNPFGSATRIAFTVPVTGAATVRVFNVLGQEVATLFEGVAEAGKRHELHFDASAHAVGAYVYVLEHGGHRIARPMLLVD